MPTLEPSAQTIDRAAGVRESSPLSEPAAAGVLREDSSPSQEFMPELMTPTAVTTSEDADLLPLVLLNFALHISEEGSVKEDLKKSKCKVLGASSRQGRERRAKTSPVLVLQSSRKRENRPRIPSASSNNLGLGLKVKTGTVTRRYRGDEKENIPPLRRVSVSSDL
ncbi:hypothetical protein B0H19DRAFT_1273547 [Mycena capillaripes]|nr:hypothetical protein B0H19DRAFT_1273547 [Mycena capillaripes]